MPTHPPEWQVEQNAESHTPDAWGDPLAKLEAAQ
jgi:hypothetical protein